MKNNIYKSMIFTILLTGLNAAAGAEDTIVDNSVKYGEKYVCAITTTDEKKYTLDLEWTAEPAKYSKTPKWDEKFVYTLKLDEVPVDNGYFSDFGFYGKTEMVFNYDSYIFSGTSNSPTRIGTNYSHADIELAKSYDKDAKTVLAVTKFNSNQSFDRYYGSVKEDVIVLNIASSVCAVVPLSKD